MSTFNAFTRDLTNAPYAVLPYFRDTKNACHEMSTNRLTPGTLRGCRASCGPAHVLLHTSSATRPYAVCTFSRSRLLSSLRTPNARRQARNHCSYTCLTSHSRRVVQYTHTIENKNHSLNSFRASCLGPPPNVTPYITKWLLLSSALSVLRVYEAALQAVSRTLSNNCPCSLGRYDCTFHPYSVQIAITAQYLSTYTLYHRTLSVAVYKNCLYLTINKNTFQRGRQAFIVTGGSWQQGGKTLLSELISSLRTLNVGMSKRSIEASRRVRTTLYRTWYAWNEGGISRTACITSLDTPLMECIPCLGQGGDASRVTPSPTLRPQSSPSLALPVRVGAASATWARNKYTATIKIQFSSVVLLSAYVKLGNQPHTTKSLTGGVLNTSLLRFHACSYIAGTIQGVL